MPCQLLQQGLCIIEDNNNVSSSIWPGQVPTLQLQIQNHHCQLKVDEYGQQGMCRSPEDDPWPATSLPGMASIMTMGLAVIPE